jgi:DNA-binding MarR family transcriptional regulator
MTNRRETPYTGLKRVFHEPSRMAIMASLCGAEDGLAFGELKTQCALTDGNLNRHIKALVDAGAVLVVKEPSARRARTMVYITDRGREHFVEYLRALENVLRRTAETLAAEENIAKTPALWHVPLTVK